MAETTSPVRTRTFSWLDPVEAVRAGEGLTGLQYLRAIADGTIAQPPLGEALGMRLVEVDEGCAVFTCVVAEHHYNLIGSVHGGFAATLLDSASGCAVMSVLGKGDRWTTLSMHVDYLAGMDVEVGPVVCEGRLVRAGRRVAVADAELRDAKGKVYARGSTTCMLMRG